MKRRNIMPDRQTDRQTDNCSIKTTKSQPPSDFASGLCKNSHVIPRQGFCIEKLNVLKRDLIQVRCRNKDILCFGRYFKFRHDVRFFESFYTAWKRNRQNFSAIHPFSFSPKKLLTTNSSLLTRNVAFSLAEMLVVLLIISLIMAMTAPIISKRAKVHRAAAAGGAVTFQTAVEGSTCDIPTSGQIDKVMAISSDYTTLLTCQSVQAIGSSCTVGNKAVDSSGNNLVCQ